MFKHFQLILKMWLYVLILVIIILIILFLIYYYYKCTYTYDFAEIISCKPYKKFKINSYKQLSQILQDYQDQQISIAGGKFSHGGQTMLNNGLYLDMIELNKIINLDKENMQVTVQAGITWDTLQQYLDVHDLSVAEMQSYRNFTVGGSISINCHGRGSIYPTIAESIVSLKVMLVNGEIVDCCNTRDIDLFKSVIGGYGLIAIILEATLHIVKNEVLTRQVVNTTIQEIPNFIKQCLENSDIDFYNCNIYPSQEHKAVHIFYRKANLHLNDLPDLPKLQQQHEYYWSEMTKEQLLRRVPFIKQIRASSEPQQLEQFELINRNYEMSYDVRQLQPLIKYPSTSILQEYFIPLENLVDFLTKFWTIVKQHSVNLLNLSIRHVGYSQIPILNYTKVEDTVAVVLYLNIWNNTSGIDSTKIWTQQAIDLALSYQGSYYLPYLPLATKQQFQLAYPNYQQFLKLKKIYDPNHKLNNMFAEEYLT